jgi:peptide subunit release factor 1 (eRF1)
MMGEDTRKLKRGGGSARISAGAGVAAGAGQRGGTGARHEDEVVQRNLRDAAAAGQQFFGQKPIRRLFIGGTAETVAQFREYLPKQMLSRVAGTFAIDMTAGEHEVRERSLELLQEANLDRERRLVATLITTAAKGGHAVVGLDDTLRTVSEGRVQTLVISDGFRSPGYWQEAAKLLSARQESGESLTAGQVQPLEDVVEAAVSRTMEQGGNIEIINDNRDLERVGRIGALLRF